MKGIVCAEPYRLEMRAFDEPEPSPGHAIVRIRRVGICGTDLHAFKGNQPFFTYPRVLGHELAGTIERIEPDASGFSPGDPVSVIPYLHCGECIACRNGRTNCCVEMKVLGVHVDGGMRERIRVPVSHLIGTKGLTLDQSAVLEPFSIGAHAVRRSALQSGETALVIGAGPIGLGVMAFAKLRGARVIAMDVNEERLEMCRTWAKVDHTVNALEQPLEEVRKLTGGDFPTAVFDATGNAGSMNGAFAYVAHGGRLVYVGLVKADITFHDPEFHKREMTVTGSRNATREDFDHVASAIRDGGIRVDRFISHRCAFDDVVGRFETWMNPDSKVIKAMIEL